MSLVRGERAAKGSLHPQHSIPNTPSPTLHHSITPSLQHSIPDPSLLHFRKRVVRVNRVSCMVFGKRMSAESSASSIFPRTDWTELGRTGEADEARLDRLIRTYWAPLRIFLVATFPSLKEQADLLLQDFAEDKILKKGWLQRADRSRGKFRDFLKTSLRNFE